MDSAIEITLISDAASREYFMMFVAVFYFHFSRGGIGGFYHFALCFYLLVGCNIFVCVCLRENNKKKD